MHYQEAEKFIRDGFFRDSLDRSSNLDITGIMNAKLIHDNKNKDVDYYSHREGVVHATSVTKCLRGVIHEMLGSTKTTEMEPRKLGIFQAGNLFEDYVINALGDRVIERQREYNYKYKNITIVGRNDGILDDDGTKRIIECKSVHSDSFFYRQKEGTLIAWQNQVQLQIYMWLERELYGNNWDAEIIYISKDDCTVSSCALRYNPDIIEKIVKPALDIINEGYTTKNPNVAPLPPMSVFNETKNQYQKNWLATYCEYHEHCAGAGWLIEATNQVTVRNKELKAGLPNPFEKKKAKATIVVEAGELPPEVQPE